MNATMKSVLVAVAAMAVFEFVVKPAIQQARGNGQ